MKTPSLPHRRRIIAAPAVLWVMLVLQACTGLKELSLYDNQNAPLPGIKGFTMTDLYHDQVSSEIWGVEMVDCKLVEVTDKIAYQGSSSLHLKWDRTKAGCPWIGFGIGWSNWLGKDLSQILDTAAIQFYARVDSGSISYIPIVFLLEGYDGKQSASVMNPLGIEGGKITQQWTKVRIPLGAFNFKTTGADMTNVKQLLLQFEGVADVYVDEMTIVPHGSSFGREEGSLTVIESDCPKSLFSDALPWSWGINPQYCRNITMDSTTFQAGFASLHVEVAPVKNACAWNEMGFSWNQWLYTDISMLRTTAALEMYIKPGASTRLPQIKWGFEDYAGHTAWVALTPTFIRGAECGPDWTQILIPLREFDFQQNDVNTLEIKALKMQVEGDAAFNLDEIKLVEFRGNPKAPFGK